MCDSSRQIVRDPRDAATYPVIHIVLCLQAHFESDQYDIVTERGDRKLKLTAVPTIFPDRPAPKRRKTDTSRRRRPAVTSCPNCTSNAVTFAERSSTYDHGYARGVAVKKTVTCTEDYSSKLKNIYYI